MKNMIYKNFNKTDKQLLAQQVASAYFYGLIDQFPPQNVVDARAAHAKNIDSLERTVLLYTSVANSHIMVSHLNDRLEQERLWLKHFDKCLQEHQRARADAARKPAATADDKPKKKKGFWATLWTAEADSTLLDPKEKRRRDLAKLRSIELANECEVLAEVELAAAAAAEAQAKAKKEAEEAKKKTEAEKNKNKNNNQQQQQQRNDNKDNSRESRRRFLQEDQGKNNEQQRNLETEKA